MDIVKAFTLNNLNVKINIQGTADYPLFRASDIGHALGIKNIRPTIQKYNEKFKVVNVDTPGGRQEVTFLTGIIVI